MKPTIVLVHGAFAESASWDNVIDALAGAPVQHADGTTEPYIVPERFHQQFCADLPAPQAARMAATQRPVTLQALTEPSGPRPLWRELPSWFVVGDEDRTIPAALQRFMAERAGARRVLGIPGGSHAAVVSHPEETAKMILEAAAETGELP
jgi:pimeloyl-ACP methyl ester carboxylesterase